jgi:mannan endo-1,4-beta-mannosidase
MHMVTLGDEGWLYGGGDGSYAYSCAEGVDVAKNLAISTLDYGTFHVYPDQ